MNVTTATKATDTVQHVLAYVCQRYNIPVEILTALRRDPRAEVLDRLMAFRADVWYDELRSALCRIEQGSYGICTVCAGRMDQDTLARCPTARICGHCLRQLNISEF